MKPRMFNFSSWIVETNPTFLKDGLSELLSQCGYKVISHSEHFFSPHGYTCLWLLAESHLAVHTFPESGCSYIELTGCNELKNEVFVSGFSVFFPVGIYDCKPKGANAAKP